MMICGSHPLSETAKEEMFQISLFLLSLCRRTYYCFFKCLSHCFSVPLCVLSHLKSVSSLLPPFYCVSWLLPLPHSTSLPASRPPLLRCALRLSIHFNTSFCLWPLSPAVFSAGRTLSLLFSHLAIRKVTDLLKKRDWAPGCVKYSLIHTLQGPVKIPFAQHCVALEKCTALRGGHDRILWWVLMEEHPVHHHIASWPILTAPIWRKPTRCK